LWYAFHVGIDDDDLRIDLVNQVIYFFPHILSLSTSSPLFILKGWALRSRPFSFHLYQDFKYPLAILQLQILLLIVEPKKKSEICSILAFFWTHLQSVAVKHSVQPIIRG